MRDVSATETAIIYGLEPVWGAGFAWFLLGERWGMTGWIGAALVLGKYLSSDSGLLLRICFLCFTLFLDLDGQLKSICELCPLMLSGQLGDKLTA